MRKLTAIVMMVAILLAACNEVQESMADYDLLVLVFGKQRIDLHDDFGVELLEGETWIMTSTNAGIVSTEERARGLAEEIYVGDDFTLLGLDLIGENDSFFAFHFSGVFSVPGQPDEPVLHRVMVQKDWQADIDGGHLYRYREDVIHQLESVVDAHVCARRRADTLRRLTTVADDMNSIWGIWDGWG